MREKKISAPIQSSTQQPIALLREIASRHPFELPLTIGLDGSSKEFISYRIDGESFFTNYREDTEMSFVSWLTKIFPVYASTHSPVSPLSFFRGYSSECPPGTTETIVKHFFKKEFLDYLKTIKSPQEEHAEITSNTMQIGAGMLNAKSTIPSELSTSAPKIDSKETPPPAASSGPPSTSSVSEYEKFSIRAGTTSHTAAPTENTVPTPQPQQKDKIEEQDEVNKHPCCIL